MKSDMMKSSEDNSLSPGGFFMVRQLPHHFTKVKISGVPFGKQRFPTGKSRQRKYVEYGKGFPLSFIPAVAIMKAEGGDFQMLFDSFEAYDVQETRRISKAEGKAEGKAEAVLDLLEGLGPVPEAVRSAVMETQELEKLKVWLKLAAGAADIEEFRGKTGL